MSAFAQLARCYLPIVLNDSLATNLGSIWDETVKALVSSKKEKLVEGYLKSWETDYAPNFPVNSDVLFGWHIQLETKVMEEFADLHKRYSIDEKESDALRVCNSIENL